MTLTVFYACVRCRLVGPARFYDLRSMWGQPAVCKDCNHG